MKKLIITAGLVSLFTAGLALAAPSEASAQEFYGQGQVYGQANGSWGNDYGRRGPRHGGRNQHRPSFQTQVVESYYESVATFSWQFDWSCYKWVYVQTGTQMVLRTQTRLVTVFWHSSWNTYVYTNLQGQLTVYTR